MKGNEGNDSETRRVITDRQKMPKTVILVPDFSTVVFKRM